MYTIMIRTNIVLPEDLKKELQFIAKKEKKSFSQVVREAGKLYISSKPAKKNPFAKVKPIKGFKISKKADGSDLSEEIDRLVYGEASN